MKKVELVEAVAEKTGLTKADTTRAIVATIVEALSKGDKVPVVGFGTFAVSERAAREGHNPRTGAKVSIPARKAPTFKAGSALKEAVNK